MTKLHSLFIVGLTILTTTAFAASPGENRTLALVDLGIAQELGVPLVYAQKTYGVGVARLTQNERQQLSKYMHEHGRCGGFESLSFDVSGNSGPFMATDAQKLEALFKHMPQPASNLEIKSLKKLFRAPAFDNGINQRVQQVSADRIRQDIQWISAYPTRRHDSANKNAHVEEMQRRLTELAKDASFPVQIEMISHRRTQQKTLRAHIEGSEKPSEVVVLGAHFDSINQSWTGTMAPGADDDGSGSANILEVFRLLMKGEQPKRSIDFFWYAAEEVGLWGSSEVAADYRARNVDVVAVLQLDMTLYPGSGELTMSLMTDFTSPWLNQYLKTLNDQYVHAKIVDDRCGYGCSDHASWNRQGYPSAIPFEATFDTMNHNIHTARDVVDQDSSFTHSAAFTQLAVAYALTLGNNSDRQP